MTTMTTRMTMAMIMIMRMTTMMMTMMMRILVRVCITLVGSEEANCVLQISTFSAELHPCLLHPLPQSVKALPMGDIPDQEQPVSFPVKLVSHFLEEIKTTCV